MNRELLKYTFQGGPLDGREVDRLAGSAFRFGIRLFIVHDVLEKGMPRWRPAKAKYDVQKTDDGTVTAVHVESAEDQTLLPDEEKQKIRDARKAQIEAVQSLREKEMAEFLKHQKPEEDEQLG